jgi:hypothetical protein
MFDPAQVVKDLLVAAGIGTFGTPAPFSIFIGELPLAPNEVVLVNQVGGRDPYPYLSVNEPSIQVFVRGKQSGYVQARAKMGDVVTALLGLSSYTHSSGDIYRSCNQLGDISYLGQDDNTRPLFSANFWFLVLPVATGNRVAIT